jgi:hypothetical protein
MDAECLELYTDKLFRLTSEDTQRLAYSYRDILITLENKHKLAHQAMLSILEIKTIMNRVSRTAELGQCIGGSQKRLRTCSVCRPVGEFSFPIVSLFSPLF